MNEQFDNVFVGKRIKQLRKLKGRTQEDVATFFGITKQAVSKWESGQSMPDIILLPKVAEYFNVSMEFFFDRKREVSQPLALNKGKVAIEINNLSKSYNPKLNIFSIQNLSLNIYSNISTAIMGPSGCGKSTLLNCVSGLEEITSGSVKIHGKEISKLKEPKLTTFRRENINFIFQQYNLVDTLNVIDNIKLPYKLSGEKIDTKKLKSLIEKLGLTGKEKSLPSKLSGGQQQRVAVARALLGKNKIIFADEPTGALDLKTGQEVLELLLLASKEFNLPVVIITHDSTVASKCDVVHFLRDGKIFNTMEKPSAEEISNIMMQLQK